MSYKKLEIWKQARELSILIHQMTLRLPKFEKYEEGGQIRRSSKSVCVNIVEGYGRRLHKNEFIRFITFAIASNDETMQHLEILFETGSLTDRVQFEVLKRKIDRLGKMLNSFIQAVHLNHGTFKN